MSTELMKVAGQGSTAVGLYDRVGDPLEFVTKIGKVLFLSRAGGVTTESEGQLMALTCLMERKSPFEINREYHLMDGKLSMKADAMLANFRKLGGKHRWVKDGSDGEAVIELTYDGQTVTSRFTIAEAKAAGLVKSKSAWEKSPANMLRARCTSNGVRMIAPEVVAGYYTPEELTDSQADASPEVAPKAKAKVATQSPQSQQQTITPQVVVADTQGDVIDAEFTVTPDASPQQQQQQPQPKSEEPPFSLDPQNHEMTVTLIEIQALIEKTGSTLPEFEASLRTKFPDFTTVDAMPLDRLKKLTEKVRQKANAAEQELATAGSAGK